MLISYWISAQTEEEREKNSQQWWVWLGEAKVGDDSQRWGMMAEKGANRWQVAGGCVAESCQCRKGKSRGRITRDGKRKRGERG